MRRFDQLIKTLGIENEKDKRDVLSLFRKREISKNSLLLKAGEEQEIFGFVIHGIFRYFYIDHKGNEKTKYFVTENDFLFSMSSFITGAPSTFYIESLTDSSVLITDVKNLKSLIESGNIWKNIYLRQLENYYVLKERREAELLLYDARRRYQNFHSEYPYLKEKVKQHHIASYLGMTPETLSRIRHELGLS